MIMKWQKFNTYMYIKSYVKLKLMFTLKPKNLQASSMVSVWMSDFLRCVAGSAVLCFPFITSLHGQDA